MIITDESTWSRGKPAEPQEVLPGDKIDIVKFNALPGPVTARLCGGAEWWIETLCVQTALMRVDVCGQTDRHCFSEVMALIDADGIEHDPETFWTDYVESEET